MENIVVETFESVIMTELYPKSEIDIIVHILESDGYYFFISIDYFYLLLIFISIFFLFTLFYLVQ